MRDWNVVVTVRERRGYRRARRLLSRFGQPDETNYFNVLALRVDDPRSFLEALRDEGQADPGELAPLSRVVPTTRGFSFQTPAEFEERARVAVRAWAPALAGRSFHIRVHRRGFKGRLSSPQEERLLSEELLEAIEDQGSSARVCYDDPDAVGVIEVIDGRAGLSLWTRDDLERYPFLRID